MALRGRKTRIRTADRVAQKIFAEKETARARRRPSHMYRRCFGGGEGCGRSLHGYLGFYGKRSGRSAARGGAGPLLDQRISCETGEAGRAGDALSTGAPRSGNRREDF